MKTNRYKMNWIDKDTIAISWNVEDVQFQAGVFDIKLSKKECRQVLEACLNQHDAAIGINWDVVDHHIHDLFGKKKRAA